MKNTYFLQYLAQFDAIFCILCIVELDFKFANCPSAMYVAVQCSVHIGQTVFVLVLYSRKLFCFSENGRNSVFFIYDLWFLNHSICSLQLFCAHCAVKYISFFYNIKKWNMKICFLIWAVSSEFNFLLSIKPAPSWEFSWERTWWVKIRNFTRILKINFSDKCKK